MDNVWIYCDVCVSCGTKYIEYSKLHSTIRFDHFMWSQINVIRPIVAESKEEEKKQINEIACHLTSLIDLFLIHLILCTLIT